MWVPWVWLGHIRKCGPSPEKLGSNVNRRPQAGGLHWTPISRDEVCISRCVRARLMALTLLFGKLKPEIESCLWIFGRRKVKIPWSFFVCNKKHVYVKTPWVCGRVELWYAIIKICVRSDLGVKKKIVCCHVYLDKVILCRKTLTLKVF